MQVSKSLYGQAILETEDLKDSKIDYLVELAYYKINQHYNKNNNYAVEIVKTEHLKDKTKIEKKKVNLYTDNENKTNYILELLKKNKVTPIGLKDIIIELSLKEIL